MSNKIETPGGAEGMVYAMLEAARAHKFTARELMALLLLPSYRQAVRGKTFIPSIVEVAEKMDIPRPSTSRSISWLTDQELVINERDKDDSRRVRLYRTPAGDALVAKMAKAASKAVDPAAGDDTEGL